MPLAPHEDHSVILSRKALCSSKPVDCRVRAPIDACPHARNFDILKRDKKRLVREFYR
jgi:hypothetical protein